MGGGGGGHPFSPPPPPPPLQPSPGKGAPLTGPQPLELCVQIQDGD